MINAKKLKFYWILVFLVIKSYENVLVIEISNCWKAKVKKEDLEEPFKEKDLECNEKEKI